MNDVMRVLSQTLTRQGGKLNLGHVEPASMLGRVGKFELFQNADSTAAGIGLDAELSYIATFDFNGTLSVSLPDHVLAVSRLDFVQG